MGYRIQSNLPLTTESRVAFPFHKVFQLLTPSRALDLVKGARTESMGFFPHAWDTSHSSSKMLSFRLVIILFAG